VIETPRLILRRWQAADVMPFQAMGQDEAVMRYLGPPVDEATCVATVERMNALADASGDCFWAVERGVDGVFIGFCGIKPGPEGTPIAGLPEIGWRLARAAWGHGFAREAAAACLARAWRRGVTHVHAITVPANERSWGLMIRLGMRRVEGGDFDHPALAAGDPLRRHIHYAIDCPK
jgi:RimJ/RimL family protein N-acetyltransferase